MSVVQEPAGKALTCVKTGTMNEKNNFKLKTQAQAGLKYLTLNFFIIPFTAKSERYDTNGTDKKMLF